MGPAYKVFFKPASALYKQKALQARVCLAGRTYHGLDVIRTAIGAVQKAHSQRADPSLECPHV
jgi:hypothetical protein